MAACKYCLSTHKIALINHCAEHPFRPFEIEIYNVRLFVRDGQHDMLSTNIASLDLQTEEEVSRILQCFGITWLDARDYAEALVMVKQDHEAKLKLFMSEYYEKEGLV